MRRRILLIALCLGCVFAFGVALRVSISNNGAAQAAFPSNGPALVRRGTQSDRQDAFDEPTELPPATTESVVILRARLLELTEKRAMRMTSPELSNSIKGIEKVLADQDSAADAMLMEGVGRLHVAVARFPGTEAAVRSAKALETLGFYVTREGRLEQHSVQATPAAAEAPDAPAIPVDSDETAPVPLDEDPFKAPEQNP